jgi:hypothetical protein
VLLRNEEAVDKLSSLMLCGRSYACAQAVGVPIGEHVPTLQPVVLVYPPKDRISFRAVSCGEGHTLALTFHGDVYSAGSNFFGQCGVGSAVSVESGVPAGSVSEPSVSDGQAADTFRLVTLPGPTSLIGAGWASSAAVVDDEVS